MKINGKEIRGLLMDLDGVFYVGKHPIPGAIEAFRQLENGSLPVCYLTNTTTKSTVTLKRELHVMGFKLDGNLLGVTDAARAYLETQGRPVCKLVLNHDAKRDFREFLQSDISAGAVVIGDIGEEWTYDIMNNVFNLVMNGAELVALHRNRFWQTVTGLQLDIGAFVAGLEYATGRIAHVMGKPAPDFFAAALHKIGLQAGEVAMVGDDIDTDIGGAQKLGMTGILVRTGKYREAYAQASKVKPDLVLDSIGDLAGYL